MKKAEYIVHPIFWGISLFLLYKFIGIEEVNVNVIDGREIITKTINRDLLSIALAGLPFKILTFYSLLLYAVPHFAQQKKWGIFTLSAASLIVIPAVLELFTLQAFFQFFYSRELLIDPLIGYEIILYSYFSVSALAFGFIKEWIQSEQLRRDLAEQKLETELKFLKSQINPHFLFNALNNLYSIAEVNNYKELSNGISKLSILLRYFIYDNEKEFISLEKEIQYLESYIEIQQLRQNSEDVLVNFKKEGNLNYVFIPPMILIPLLENAYKHGIRVDKTSIIDISISYANSLFKFQIQNFIANQNSKNLSNDNYSGLGLSNIQKRLELIYPNRHELNIHKERNLFTVEMTIKLNANQLLNSE